MAGMAGFFFFRLTAVSSTGGNSIVGIRYFTVVSVALRGLQETHDVGVAVAIAAIFVFLAAHGAIQF
jgi:hypothetical protein